MADERENEASSIEDIFTDAQLLAWAAGLGVDLQVRGQLLDSLAVGLTVLLWRNTALEDVHSGDIQTWLAATGQTIETGVGADEDVEDEYLNEVVEAFRAARRASAADISVSRWDWEQPDAEAEWSADEDRLARVLEHAAMGFGIPDDVMLRANASTCADLRMLLDEALPGSVCSTDPVALGPADIEDLPEFLWTIYSFFADLDREIQVGQAYCAAFELLGETGSEVYLRDLEDRWVRLIGFMPKLGTRRALWYSAVSGAGYATEWYPCPQWTRALGLATSRGGTEPDLVWHRRPGDLTATGEMALWVQAECPFELTGRQADWVLDSRVGRLVREVRQQDAEGLGEPRNTFNALLALF